MASPGDDPADAPEPAGDERQRSSTEPDPGSRTHERDDSAGGPAPADPGGRPVEADPQEEASAAPTASDHEASGAPPKSGASLIMAGILASRVLGLVREKVVVYYFGLGGHYDVYQLLMRGANLLNNLLGEGTLSASFIPIYSRMLEEGRQRDAGRFAGAILGLMIAIATAFTVAGVLSAKVVVSLLAPGFLDDAEKVATGALEIDRYAVAVDLFVYALPMAAFLALSAWALGVLNSHRRFFVPYVAPTVMNVSTITALVWAATTQFDDPFGMGAITLVPVESLNTLLLAAVVGALVGGVLQFAVQLP
ncbi:MAG: lipid II flippase MurJ, partial [Bacteroidota bacterium]